MRKIVFVAMLFAMMSCSGIKTVGYSHKILSSDGCTLKYHAVNVDGERFIVVQMSSDDLVFTPSPKLKLLTFGNKVIELEGESLSAKTRNSAVLIGSVLVPVSSVKSMAQFKIEDEQVDLLKSGVKKVQLTTVPFVHRKTFAVDKIGRKLYDMLTTGENGF